MNLLQKDHVGEALGMNKLGIVISFQVFHLRIAIHFFSPKIISSQAVGL